MDLFDLAAKITLDTSGYERGIKDASGTASEFGGKITKALSTIGKISTAAIGASAAGIAAIVKQSVDAYSNYEQLAGGVETLFGDSAKQVMADAQQAFKTAGMTANQYMETSIQSAASLINSLGGDQAKAADLMSMSITDMADNANKMGTDMEAIQNAYRGFSRGNFTMLDNLALGFAGTKEGMQELLDKAQEVSGVKYDISSYADIVEAIHVVQTEMGITGTTAKEAASTIQGSIGSMKSAWENLVTGLSDNNADISQLVGNLIDSAGTVAGNLIPVIKQALIGVGTAITQLAPALMEGFTGLISDVLPGLVESALSLVSALGTALAENADAIVSAAFQIINMLVSALSDPNGLVTMIDAAFSILESLSNGLIQNLPTLLPAIIGIIMNIYSKLLEPGNIMMLVNAAIALLMALADGIISSIDIVASKAPEIVLSLLKALVQAAPLLLDAAVTLLDKIGEGIMSGLSALWDIGLNIVKGIWQGISNGLGWIKSMISGWVGNVMDFIMGLFGIHSPSKWAEQVIGKNLAVGMALGITSNADEVEDAMDGLSDNVKAKAEMSLNTDIPSIAARITPSDTTSATSRSGATLGDILMFLQQTLPAMLANHPIVLDSGELVSVTLPLIDEGLGEMSVYAGRANA